MPEPEKRCPQCDAVLVVEPIGLRVKSYSLMADGSFGINGVAEGYCYRCRSCGSSWARDFPFNVGEVGHG